MPEGDLGTPFDPKLEIVSPLSEPTAVRPPPPPPAPEKPMPKPTERTADAPAPIPPTAAPDPPAVAALRAYLDNRPVATREPLQLLCPVVASGSMREMERSPQGVA